MPFPKPPIKTMTDFVVFCFVSVVIIIIVISTVSTAIIVIFYPDRDVSTAVQILSSILTTLLGALFGFMGGRGYNKVEHKEKESKE